ncbi:S9 family peptidase [Kocuria sp.]|uniref:alpha/beta hydrolase family protein n=1 Tax=Kocuria sp. TaxID=1871328 RepID=UPI0026DCA49B|nr:alpha/beta fold hydrolase [Kocuria sp.]MDO4918850.1 prolyl oligopeptidase family serine peptidase [Kocuria sp.]
MASRYATPADLVTTPRLTAVRADPHGPAVVLRQELSSDATRYVTHAWSVPSTGEPGQLTHGDKGVREVCPTPTGSLWFTSDRPAPADEDKHTRLWLLPEHGEARMVLDAPEGISGLQLGGNRLFFVSGLYPAARGAQDEFARNREIHDRRKESGASGVLHERSPIRFWDHDLPAAQDALWFLDTTALVPGEDAAAAVHRVALPPGRLGHVSVAPDGTWLLVELDVLLPSGAQRGQLWRVPAPGTPGRDGADSEPQLLHDAAEDCTWAPGAVSPDGTRALLVRERLWRDGVNMALSTWVREMATGEETEVVPADEHWAEDAQWLDDETFVCTSDHRGRGIVLRVHCPRGGVVHRSVEAGGTGQDWTYSSVRVAGAELVGLRADYAHPPQLVRWPAEPDAAASSAGDRDGTAQGPAHAGGGATTPHPAPRVEPTAVPGLVPEDTVPGRLEEVTATAEDGTPIRAWLALPQDEAEGTARRGHPLVVFVHGGPWGSSNQWSWRWNPWPFVARGYAVLLPDPAISTGYGQEMIERGQQELGGSPFTDVMALVAAATGRADIDPGRQALMGGSYGGYMANWVATHTGTRFRCIVTHASLWNLDAMGATTDNTLWREAMGPRQAAEYSPHRFAEDIAVPLLVIHGDKDYRVPVSQGLELWADLQSRTSVEGHRFLYYPDEGHWILKPANARTWYETTLAFLGEHVLGDQWHTPELLG